ncbi:MAG: ABC transporter ATP-binding protein, partial [Armatimonadota bacterium]
GQIVGFIGDNGAGKSTTMRILVGVLSPTIGHAWIADHEVTQEPLAAREHIGYLPENMALYDDMTVYQYLTYRAKLCGVHRHDRDDRVWEVMEMCRIDDVWNVICGKLSKGYRQRVGLAQALVHDPDVLILDEPTIGLDPVQVVETRELIRQLARDHTVLLSTHILSEVGQICQEVIIIDEGEIKAMDTVENLTRAMSEARGLYVRVRDRSATVVQGLKAIPGVVAVEPTPADGQQGVAYVVRSEAGKDVREAVASTVGAKNWGLLEIRPLVVSLEDVFVEMTGR